MNVEEITIKIIDYDHKVKIMEIRYKDRLMYQEYFEDHLPLNYNLPLQQVMSEAIFNDKN